MMDDSATQADEIESHWKLPIQGQQQLDNTLVAPPIDKRLDRRRQKQPEGTAQRDEQRFRDFAQALSDWLWEINTDYRLTWLSQEDKPSRRNPLHQYGKTLEEVIDTDANQQQWQRYCKALAQRNTFRDLEFCKQTIDGLVWYRLSGVPIYDDSGVFQGYRGVGVDITDSHTLRQQAEEANNRFRNAIEAFAGTFALYDTNDRLIAYNQEYANKHTFLGNALSQNPTFEQCLRTQLAKGLITEAQGREEEWLQERLHRFHYPQGPFELKKSNELWLQVREQRLPNGYLLALGIDITDLKKTEHALRKSEARFKDFAETAADWFWESDPDLCLSYLSERYQALTGDSPERIIGNRLLSACAERLMSPEQQTRFANALQTQQPFDGVELIYSCAGQEERYFLLSGKPYYDDDGQFLGYRGAGSNVTENKRAEIALTEERSQLAQRVKERTAELQKANEELAQAMRAKDTFLAGMSHELRTPLNAIMGLTEMLQLETQNHLSSAHQHMLKTVYSSSQHLLELINDVLDLAQVGAGEMKLALTEVSIDDVCQAAVQLIKPSADKKNLSVIPFFDPMLGKLHADERRLKQILVNLLSNAVKFTPHNGSIGLEVQGDTEMVRFIVSDTGIGISTDGMKRLFKPFVQLDSRITREYGGTGLGLSLVYHMVEMHGGSISVESAVGAGSHFIVSLPRESSSYKYHTLTSSTDHKAIYPQAVATLETTPTAAEHGLILIAEDNEENAFIFTNYLQSKGYQTIRVSNGADAITQAQQHLPNLILMDIQMPNMDGLEAIRRLRAEARFGKIPIIALTALAMPGDRERCLSAGANEYLSKPIRLQRLGEVIQAQLKPNRLVISN